MPMTSLRHRVGFTFVELLIALTLALLISSITLTLIQRRERFYRELSAILGVRARTHDATAILAAELRSATDSIWSATDTSVDLSITIGVGVVCAIPNNAPPGRTVIELTPDSSTGIAPASFLSPPDSLDALLIYHDSSAPAPAPTSGWTRHTLLHISHPLAKNSCPPTTGFTTTADVSTNRRNYEFLLADVPSPIHIGSPVRVIRRARYNLYRASDNLWYLGYRRCDLTTPTTCAAVQPISGPYAGHTPAFTFHYYDANGTPIVAPTLLATIRRIDIVAHAATETPLKLLGAMNNTPFVDSSSTTIALRNAK